MQATRAPQTKYHKLLPVTYIYAAVLAALAVVQLMGMGGFDFASIAYTTPGLPVVIVAIAALEIFALPFLLRFDLSPLARFFSAVFALVAPFFVLGNVLYVASQNGLLPSLQDVFGGVLLVVLGVASFVILGGPKALKR